MSLTGRHLIGGTTQASGRNAFAAKHATTGEQIGPDYFEAIGEEVDECLQLADAAFELLQAATDEQIASLLESIADGLEAAGDPLLEHAHAETALPLTRLTAEHGRTINQTRMFAQMVRDGSWVQARIDHGRPDREPLPKPDVRTMLRGVGPVVVFGASNFPLAISVAGTDTVSALAARCSVVVKAHPGHPGTCEMIGQVIADAVNKAGLPPGTFALLQGAGHEVGQAMVAHPLTAAAAFTGSLRGGRALFDVAVTRQNPIPFYAEMGSVNPVFLLPGALAERAEAIAQGYIQSVNMGVGQFCTNPGIVLATSGDGLDQFFLAAAAAVEQSSHATMLHEGIQAAYEEGQVRLLEAPGVKRLAVSAGEADRGQVACSIFAADVKVLDEQPALAEEVFGPMSLILQCDSSGQMLAFARRLEGQLTATIHGTEQDLLDNTELVRVLERKVGRIIFNGFPTGIEVCAAMHHGGPYPATTHSGFTSIGHAAIYRFTKPVCFQNFPDSALPAELRGGNPRGIKRLVDGELVDVK